MTSVSRRRFFGMTAAGVALAASAGAYATGARAKPLSSLTKGAQPIHALRPRAGLGVGVEIADREEHLSARSHAKMEGRRGAGFGRGPAEEPVGEGRIEPGRHDSRALRAGHPASDLTTDLDGRSSIRSQ